MKLVRTLFLLAAGIAIAGFVQAESASIYMHIKKGARRAHRPQAVTSELATAGHFVVRANPDIAIEDEQAQTQAQAPAAPSASDTTPIAQAGTPEKQPLETILPQNSRIVQGDDTKDEFYILAENEQEPVKPIEVSLRQHQMAVDTQLKRVDTKESMWAVTKPAHVDVILSQIAHNITVSEQHMNVASARKETAAKSLFQGEKNGDVVNIEVALDKVLAEVDAQNQMPSASLSSQTANQQVLKAVISHKNTRLSDNGSVVQKLKKPVVKKQMIKESRSKTSKKIAFKKRDRQRIYSQNVSAKPLKVTVKKLTQKKIKAIKFASKKHKARQPLLAQRLKVRGAKLASKHNKTTHLVMHKVKHKLQFASGKQNHIAAMHHKNVKQHFAMRQKIHMANRRHTNTHVYA